MKENLTALIKALSERQQAAERQLSELSAAVKTLEAKIAEFSQPAAPHALTAPAKAAQATPGKPMRAEVTAEILVILAAAATTYLGKEVRIRSAKMLQSPYEVINPWVQQGRVFIHASHNLR